MPDVDGFLSDDPEKLPEYESKKSTNVSKDKVIHFEEDDPKNTQNPFNAIWNLTSYFLKQSMKKLKQNVFKHSNSKPVKKYHI